MNKRVKKVLVLTDHMPWGHRSIAKAIYSYLKDNGKGDFEVHYAEVKAKTGPMRDLYTLLARFVPNSNRLAYRFGRRKIIKDFIEDYSVVNLLGLKKEVEKINPDLIISAYFFHSHSLTRWRKKEKKDFKIWTIVADPWSIHPISAIKDADLNIVYDEVGVKEVSKLGVDKDKIWKTGWWVRQEMYKKFNKEEARKKLGFSDDRPVIFIGGGSLGTSALSKLLPTMLTIKKKVGFVINTGTDKLTYNVVEQFNQMLKRLKKDKLIMIKNYGWIDNLTEVLSGCDMVFGKAGPNFLFDVMAVGKPFVAITHIGGQEDGNIDLIKAKKLGWIKEKGTEMSSFLIKYIDNTDYFEKKYSKNISREAEKNKESLPLILERVRETLK
jgi:UDP-N-acetylglucosamine:LPS N-acetylglucosamine transferase